MNRSCTEHHFTAPEGASLFYRRWAASGPRRGAILLVHRGHEHGGRMAHLAEELELPDFDVYAWDARGHGRSTGKATCMADLARDLEDFVAHLQSAWKVDPRDLAVVAQSVGAVVAAAWAHDYAPKVRAMVLASPAFRVKLYVPFARPALKLWRRLHGPFSVTSYVKSRALTRDVQRQASYDADLLITRPISADLLLDLYDTAERVVADAQAITVPTQVLVSGSDWVVRRQPQLDFAARLGASVKEVHLLEGLLHDTLGERDRQRPLALARTFIRARFDEPFLRPDLRQAHLQGPTFEEARRLVRPHPWFHPLGLFWKATRGVLRLLGLLSEGIALGHRTGFDSGSTLDYVYRNRPSGLGILGRAVDRQYLEAIGWRGIRRRKNHLEATLRDAMGRLRGEGRPVRILDVAAGHGRYVLEALEGQEQPEAVRLRDFSPLNVAAGQALIAAKGMEGFAAFDQGDAFDGEGVAAVQPRPTVAVVSGLYELFEDNDQVGRSLAGIAQAVEPGGYLIYTDQPWHPQLEFIARALTSHRDGRPWVMRRRTQGEMDQLVEAAGFEKVAQRIDRWGIFTVSLARRAG